MRFSVRNFVFDYLAHPFNEFLCFSVKLLFRRDRLWLWQETDRFADIDLICFVVHASWLPSCSRFPWHLKPRLYDLVVSSVVCARRLTENHGRLQARRHEY
jgi:DMSO/TMAO reductase YedYZ heme-binding membrane subunit